MRLRCYLIIFRSSIKLPSFYEDMVYQNSLYPDMDGKDDRLFFDNSTETYIITNSSEPLR